MDAEQRIKRLETRIAYLETEKNTAVSSLDLAASLGNFSFSLSKLHSPAPILEEFATKLSGLVKMEAFAIYLVSEEDADLHQAYCSTEEHHALFEKEIDTLIHNNTLAWALGRRKPLTLLTSEKQGSLLIHSLSTASRTRGVLLGLLSQDQNNILDVTFSLLTILCNALANILESYELYHYISTINKELENHVERLRESKFEIMQHRNRLQEEVARQTKDLLQANEQLKNEIKKRIRIEKYLIKERDFISAVLETTSALVLVINPRGFIERCNRASERVTGFSTGDMIGSPIWKFCALPQEQDEAREFFEKNRQTAKDAAFERYLQTKQGEQRCIAWSTTAILDKKRAAEFIIATGIDITEKKRTENALRDAEAMYRNIFEQAVEGIFLTSPAGITMKVNPALAHMLGYETPEEFLEAMHDEYTMFAHPYIKKRILSMLRSRGRLSGLEIRVRHRDGHKLWVAVNAQAVRDAEGRIVRFEGLLQDITERKLSERQLQRMATMDNLTAIPNRYLFMDRFEQMLAQAKRLDHMFVLLYLDLDYFKEVNDRHGHHIGDLLLREVAARLKARVRKSDTVARLGGDEFTILLYNIKKSVDLEKIAKELIATLGQPYYPKKKKCVIGVSIGISMFPCDGDTTEILLRKADNALYAAKAAGRNAFRFASNFCSPLALSAQEDASGREPR